MPGATLIGAQVEMQSDNKKLIMMLKVKAEHVTAKTLGGCTHYNAHVNDIFDLSHCCCVQCVCKKPIKVVGGLPVSIGQPVLADGILVVQFEQEAMPEKPTAMAWTF